MALAIFVCAAVAAVTAQQPLEVLPVQGNVFVIVAPGGNTTVQIGPEGPLVVDAQPAALSAAVLDAIRSRTAQPIRHIVLTSGDDQAAGGAGTLSKAGRYVRVIDSIDPRGSDTRASIIAHLNVLNRMNATKAPTDIWPTDTYFTAQWTLFSNGEAVRFVHVPAAHTDGDTMVFFRRSDVIATGDVFRTDSFPVIDVATGGSIDGTIAALNKLLDLAVPSKMLQEGGTYVIPGHGRISDEHELVWYRDMLVIIRDRIKDMVARKQTLDQVKAARPALDYEGRYGADTGAWTTAMFVEAIYKDLSR
jgi:glyoxylase-like metal-dependent hydrolase (beta-lactamase superfamily II)